MNTELSVTLLSTRRPWWRPLGLRALRNWYRHFRRERRGRLFSALGAVVISRLEFRIGGREIS